MLGTWCEISCDCGIAACVQRLGRERWPLTSDPAAPDGATYDPNDIAMAIIGAAVAVFAYGVAEARDGDDGGAGEGGARCLCRGPDAQGLPVRLYAAHAYNADGATSPFVALQRRANGVDVERGIC